MWECEMLEEEKMERVWVYAALALSDILFRSPYDLTTTPFLSLVAFYYYCFTILK
ncbi:hypothetical protein AtNW77_Chr5g0123841 [Arabidopsis thaliana]|uniref:Transmembrane protein n=1 Tax=Arabidopsis thaliana x Arabidopsis arenosa TaxID=1240361 RepID=A0A8T2CYS5_9BRAS|nr:hypothetical protein ISN45_At05g035920 [Arabidopsis thaliana x Arabidopsis arenosa]